MKTIVTIGLDITKQVLRVLGARKEGRTVLRRKLMRNEVVGILSELPPCVVGIEPAAAHSVGHALSVA